MDFFFNPKSVAVVGASQNPFKFGSIIVHNLFTLGYEGRIYPVNPNPEDIAGLKTYASVAEIPDPVEVVIIAVPSSRTLQVMQDCARKRVRGVIIISSGFRESGEEGLRLQQQILDIARSAGIRIIGPNTTGILNPHDKFTSTFVPLREVKQGPVAFIAQTGMFAGMLMEWILSSESFGISKVAGLGNKCDIDDADALEYLTRDEHTKAIMMYIESIVDGRRFLAAARSATRLKPVLALKSGQTPEGATAAVSHTGSLANNDAIVSAALKQAGIIRVDAFQKLIDHAKLLAYQPIAQGDRLSIVSLSGGAAVMSADAAIKAGFRLTPFPQELLDEVQKLYPPWATFRHPMDIEPLTETVGIQRAFEMTVECAFKNPATDAVLVVTWSPFPEIGFTFGFIKELQTRYPRIPVAVTSIGYKPYHEELFNHLESMQIPVYPNFNRAIESLAASRDYGRYLASNTGNTLKFDTVCQMSRSDPPDQKPETSRRAPDPQSERKFHKLTIYFDGASHGNPGPASIGVVIKEPGGETVLELGEAIGEATNNYAEYCALIRALQEAKKLGAEEVDCVSDSELVVRQMTGLYKVKSKNIIPLIQKAQTLRREFRKFSIRHVTRDKNQRADSLAAKALKKKRSGN